MSQKTTPRRPSTNRISTISTSGKPSSESLAGSNQKVHKLGVVQADAGRARKSEESAKAKRQDDSSLLALEADLSVNTQDADGDQREYGIRYITDDLLKRIAKEENLERVTKLNLNLSKESNDKRFKFIENLDKCRRLEVLNLSYNAIERIQKLERLTLLRELNLSYNRITRIEGLDGLVHLRVLNLTGNRISTIPNGFASRLPILQTLHIARNNIESLEELRKLRFCANLVQLSFAENGCAELPHARHFVVFHLRTLHVLDAVEVSDAERQAAASRFERDEIDRLERTLTERERDFTSLQTECETLRTRFDEASRDGERNASERGRLRDELAKLEHAVQTKDELVRRKTAELTRACQKHFELEQELTFFKIDAKFDALGHPPTFDNDFASQPEDAEDADEGRRHAHADIPYMGRARYSAIELPARPRARPRARQDFEPEQEVIVPEPEELIVDDGDEIADPEPRRSQSVAQSITGPLKASRGNGLDEPVMQSQRTQRDKSGHLSASARALAEQPVVTPNMAPKEVLLMMANELGKILPADLSAQPLGDSERARLNELTLNAAKSILEAAAGQRFQYQTAVGSSFATSIANPHASGNTVNDRDAVSSSHTSQLFPARSQSAAPILERGRLSRSRSGFATPAESNIGDDSQLDAVLIAAKQAIAGEQSSRAAGLLFGTQATATLSGVNGADVADVLTDEIPPELLEKLHTLLDEELTAKQDAIQRTEERLSALQTKLETTENRVEVATGEYSRIVKLLAKRKRAQDAGQGANAAMSEMDLAKMDDADEIPSDLQIDPSDMEALTALIEAGDDSVLLHGVIDEAQIAGDSQPDIQDLLQKKLGAVNTLKGEADRLRSEMDLTEDAIKKQQRDVENLRLSLKRLDSKESLYKEVQRQVNDKEQQLNANNQLYSNLQRQLDSMLTNMRKETEEIRDLEVRLRTGQSEQNAEMRRELETIVGTMQDYLSRTRRENEQQRAEYARLLEEKRALEKRLSDIERLRHVRKTPGNASTSAHNETADATGQSQSQTAPEANTQTDNQQHAATEEALELALTIKREKLTELARMRSEIDNLEDELRTQRDRQAELRKRLAEPTEQQQQQPMITLAEPTRRESASEKYLDESTVEQTAKQQPAMLSDTQLVQETANRMQQSRMRAGAGSHSGSTSVSVPATSTPSAKSTLLQSRPSTTGDTVVETNFVDEDSVRRTNTQSSQAQRSRLPLPQSQTQISRPAAAATGIRKEPQRNAPDEDEEIEEVELYSPNPLTPRPATRRDSDANSEVDSLAEQPINHLTNSGDIFLREETDPVRSRRRSGPVAYTLDTLSRDGTLDGGTHDADIDDMALFDEEDVEYPEPDNPRPTDDHVEPREINAEFAPTRLRTTQQDGEDDQLTLDDYGVADGRDDADLDEMFVVLQRNPTADRERPLSSATDRTIEAPSSRLSSRNQLPLPVNRRVSPLTEIARTPSTNNVNSHKRPSMSGPSASRSPLANLPSQRGLSPSNASVTQRPMPSSPSRLRDHLKRLQLSGDALPSQMPLPVQSQNEPTLDDEDEQLAHLQSVRAGALSAPAFAPQDPESQLPLDSAHEEKRKHRRHHRRTDENASDNGADSNRRHKHKHRHGQSHHRRKRDANTDTVAEPDTRAVISVSPPPPTTTITSNIRSHDRPLYRSADLLSAPARSAELTAGRSLDQLGTTAGRRLTDSQPDFHVTYSRSVEIADDDEPEADAEAEAEADGRAVNGPYDSLNEDEVTDRRPKPLDISIPKLDIAQLEIDALDERLDDPRHARRSQASRTSASLKKGTKRHVGGRRDSSSSSRHLYMNEDYLDEDTSPHDRVRSRDIDRHRATSSDTGRVRSQIPRASPKSTRTDLTNISTMRELPVDVDAEISERTHANTETSTYNRDLEALVEAKVSDVQRQNVELFDVLTSKVGLIERLIQRFLASAPDLTTNVAENEPDALTDEHFQRERPSLATAQGRRVFPNADNSDDENDSVMLTDDGKTPRAHLPRSGAERLGKPKASEVLRRIMQGTAKPSWYETMSSDEQALFDEVNNELLRLKQQVEKMQAENDEKLSAALSYIRQLETERDYSTTVASARVPVLNFAASESTLDSSQRDRFVSLSPERASATESRPNVSLPNKDADTAYISELEQLVQAQALKLDELRSALTNNSQLQMAAPDSGGNTVNGTVGSEPDAINQLLNESVEVLSSKQQEVQQMRMLLDTQRDEILRLNDMLDRLCGMANAASAPAAMRPLLLPQQSQSVPTNRNSLPAPVNVDLNMNERSDSFKGEPLLSSTYNLPRASQNGQPPSGLANDDNVQTLITLLRQHLEAQAPRSSSNQQTSPLGAIAQRGSMPLSTNAGSGEYGQPHGAHNSPLLAANASLPNAVALDASMNAANSNAVYGHSAYALVNQPAASPLSGLTKQAQTETLAGGAHMQLAGADTQHNNGQAPLLFAQRAGRVYTYAHGQGQQNRYAKLCQRAERALSGEPTLLRPSATFNMNVTNADGVQSYYCDVPEHHNLETYLNRLLARNEELEALLRQSGIAFRNEDSGWTRRADANEETIRELRMQVDALRRETRKARQRALDAGPSEDTLTTIDEDYTTDDSTRRRRDDDAATRARRHKLAESIRRLEKTAGQRDAEVKELERTIRDEQAALERSRDATQRDAEERGRIDAELRMLSDEVRTLEERRAYLVSECDCLAQTCSKRHAELADTDRVTNDYRERLVEIEAKTSAAVRDYERARADQRDTLRETERLAEQVLAVRRELAEQSALVNDLDAESRDRLTQKRALDAVLKDVLEVIQLRDADFQTLDRRCHDAAAQFATLQTAMNSLVEQEREKVASLRNCDALISEKHEELTKLERQVRDARLDCETIESVRAQKQTELQAIEKDCEQKAAVATRQCREAETRVREKEKAVRELHAAIETLEQERSTAAAAIIDSRRELEQLEAARTREQRTLDQLVSAISKQKVELRKALEELRDEQTALQTVQRTVADRQRDADRLDTRLETERNALTELEAERRKRQTELDAVRSALAVDSERRDATRTELAALDTQLAAAKTDLQATDELVEQTKRKLAQVRRSHEQTNELAQVAQSKFNKLELELDTLCSNVDEKRSERDAIASEVERLTTRVNDLESRSRSLKQTAEEQESAIQRGADELARRTREKDSLNAELAELRERVDAEKQQLTKTNDSLLRARDELKSVEAELFERQLEAQEARKTSARLKKECEKEQARVEKLLATYSHDLETLKTDTAEKQQQLELVSNQLETVRKTLSERQFTEAKLDKLEFQVRIHEDELRKTGEEKQQLSAQLSRALSEAQSSREQLAQTSAQLESRVHELEQSCAAARSASHERERDLRALRKATRQQAAEMEQLLFDYCFRLSEAQEEVSARKIEVLELRQRLNLQLDAARVRDSLLEEDENERHTDGESTPSTRNGDRRKRSQRVTFQSPAAAADSNGSGSVDDSPSNGDSLQTSGAVNVNDSPQSDAESASIDSAAAAAELFAKTAARMSATDLKMQLRVNGDRVRSQLRSDLMRNYSNMHGDANRTQANLHELKAKLRHVEAILADAGASRTTAPAGHNGNSLLDGTLGSDVDLRSDSLAYRNVNNLSMHESARPSNEPVRGLGSSSFASLTTSSNNYSQNGSEAGSALLNLRDRPARSSSLDKLANGRDFAFTQQYA